MKFLFFIFLITIAALSVDSLRSRKKNNPKGKAPWIELNDGHKMPSFGFGTSAGYGKTNDKAQTAVEDAIDAGYRLIDTAESYKNEDVVGQAISKKINDGVIKREDIFVLTKLWNDHHARHIVMPTLKEQLKKLKLDYVDMYLMHWPIEEFANNTLGDTDYMETWEGMVECQKLGLAKSIGVANFNPKQIERIIKNSKVKPAVLEVEVNPNMAQKKLIKFCEDNSIKVIAYAPLGSMPDAKKKKNSPPPSLDDPILTGIANKYKKNTVQIVLRYLYEKKVVPIPKSTTTARIYENIDIFSFHLSLKETKQIDDFNKDFRVIDVPEWKNHKYYPFNYDL